MYVLKNKLYLLAVVLTDLFGYIAVFALRIFKTPGFPAEINNILVIRLDHIGDLVSAASVAENIKAHYPRVKLDFLAPSWAGQILKNNPYIDKIIPYDAPWFSRGSKQPVNPAGFFGLARQLRRARYDLGFDLRGDIRHILLMALGGVKFKVGYGITGGGFLLERNVVYRREVSATEKNLDLLRATGITIVTGENKFYISEKDRLAADKIFADYGFWDKDFIAAIHPFAGYSSKNWQEEKFAQLISALRQKYSANTILLGSEKDREANSRIAEMAAGLAVNLAGVLPLGILPALLKKVSVFIGVDSGPSHIAASVGCPAVILYSGTNSAAEWVPGQGSAAIVKKDVPCAGCEKLNCSRRLCMELITPDEVMDAVKGVVKL